MATIIQFEELKIWKEARSMNRVIWKLTSRARLVRYPFMQDQLRRASLSVMNNISEGFERDGNAEFCSIPFHWKRKRRRTEKYVLCIAESGIDYRV